MFFWTLGIIIWVFIALWPALLANKKGHSFFLFLIFSWFFFPLALLSAFVVRDRRKTR